MQNLWLKKQIQDNFGVELIFSAHTLLCQKCATVCLNSDANLRCLIRKLQLSALLTFYARQHVKLRASLPSSRRLSVRPFVRHTLELYQNGDT